MNITVIIVTFQSARFVGPCLAGLQATVDAPADPSVAFELIVVDNGSDDDTLKIARHVAPSARLIEMGANAGYAAAVNAGWRAASPGSHILILNPDIVITAKAIYALARALEEQRGDGEGALRVGAVVPRLVGTDGATQPSLRRDPTILRVLGEAVLGGERAGHRPRWGERVLDPRTYEVPHDVEWASGAALLVDHRCFDDVGPWDETFFLYSEETDFFLRARDRGWRIRYIPDSVVEHVGGEVHSSPLLWSLLVANRVRLHRKRHGSIAAVGFACALAINELLRVPHDNGTHRAGLRMVLWPRRRASVIQKLREAASPSGSSSGKA